jgi:hypothetical protein
MRNRTPHDPQGVDRQQLFLCLNLEKRRMKRFLTWVCLFGFLATVAGSAVAQEKPDEKKKPDREAAFKKMDKNNDGKLTVEEFKANKKGKALENADKAYARLDKDKDGSVSLEEFKNLPMPKKKKDEK